MKKLNRLQINPERLIQNDELITLKGGYSSYLCYQASFDGQCISFSAAINTASCQMAKEICYYVWGGSCVEGGDC